MHMYMYINIIIAYLYTYNCITQHEKPTISVHYAYFVLVGILHRSLVVLDLLLTFLPQLINGFL